MPPTLFLIQAYTGNDHVSGHVRLKRQRSTNQQTCSYSRHPGIPQHPTLLGTSALIHHDPSCLCFHIRKPFSSSSLLLYLPRCYVFFQAQLTYPRRPHLSSAIFTLQPVPRPVSWPLLSYWIAITPAPPRMWSSGGSRDYWGQNNSTLTQQILVGLLLETKHWTSCKDSRGSKDRESVWPPGVHWMVGLTDMKPSLIPFII